MYMYVTHGAIRTDDECDDMMMMMMLISLSIFTLNESCVLSNNFALTPVLPLQ